MIAWFVLLQATLGIAVAGPLTSPEYLPLHVAQAEGLFAEEKLAVSLQPMRAEAPASEALSRGGVQLAATSLDGALRLGNVDGKPPRLVFGLTAVPPVALLVSSAHKDTVRSVKDLAGKTVGIPAPGTPEHLIFLNLLARAGLGPARVSLLSFGERGAMLALQSGEAEAVMLSEPFVSRLVDSGAAVVLADFRKRAEAERWLGGPTVSAAVFARADTKLGGAELQALTRALLGAVARVQSATPEELQARLPAGVVGSPADFALRVTGAREIYLPRGWVTADMLADSVRLVRERAALPASVRLPWRLRTLLLLGPLEEVLRAQRP